MTEHMNPGLPSLIEQERARRAVVDTLEAAAALLTAEGLEGVALKEGATNDAHQFALGVRAGMRLAGKRLSHHAAQARRAVIQ